MQRTIYDLIAELPEQPAYGPYDGMTVSPSHFCRVLDSTEPSKNMTFAGVKLIANPAIPDGYAVLTNHGKPVGVIDFKSGRATVMRNQS